MLSEFITTTQPTGQQGHHSYCSKYVLNQTLYIAIAISALDTSISKVSFVPQNVIALKGASVIFNCTIILNYAIGPDHSALQVVWTPNSDSLSTNFSVTESTTNIFFYTTMLQDITNENYCCQACISDTIMSACSSVTVHGKKNTVLFC